MRHPSSSARVIPKQDAIARIYGFCAYQERSHQEVRAKLISLGLRVAEAEEILAKLITDGFVNEERFAKTFAGGKFRIKKWGRLKIERELAAAGVSPGCIRIGIEEIDGQAYLDTLRRLVQRKSDVLSEEDLYKRRHLLARFVIAKGYEPDLVWEVLYTMWPR